VSLVLELQREALSHDTKVSPLLRKAKAVAVKLKLEEFRVWVDLELEGYQGREVPAYRLIKGQLKALNPYRGLIPMMFGDPEIAEKVSSHHCRMGLGPIEELVSKHDDTEDTFHVPLPDNLQLSLMQLQGDYPLPCVLLLPKSGLVRILDSVRNSILDWSLKLEADGILGEGMSFSSQEKEVASGRADQLGPPINILMIGKMENSQVQHGSPNSKQNGGG
jgi:hypothetical protein